MGRTVKLLYETWLAKRHPNALARRLGVNLVGEVTFYDMRRGMFGSEPWMVTLGDGTYITSGVQFITHDGGTLVLRQFDPTLEWSAPITVGNHVYMGMRTLVLPGVTIGDRVVIGAGSVVTKDVQSDQVVAGVPARKISTLSEYLQKMQAKSLGIGHLCGAEKDMELRRRYLNEVAD